MAATQKSHSPIGRRPVASDKFFLGSLKKRWRDCRKELKRCRKRISHESVHDVRIAIRRLLATLGLLAGVLPPDKVLLAGTQLKKRLKIFSKLRDTHAQMVCVGTLCKSFPAAREYHDTLEKRERHLIQRVQRRLSHTKDEPLVATIACFKAILRKVAQEATGEADRVSAVTTAFRAAFVEVKKRHRAIRPTKTATIHRARVAFKKFRYMTESLQPLLPGVTRRTLNAMRNYQGRMGDIQDLDVLLRDLDKFVENAGEGTGSWDDFITELGRRRSVLVRRFIASMGQFNGFASVASARVTLRRSI